MRTVSAGPPQIRWAGWSRWPTTSTTPTRNAWRPFPRLRPNGCARNTPGPDTSCGSRDGPDTVDGSTPNFRADVVPELSPAGAGRLTGVKRFVLVTPGRTGRTRPWGRAKTSWSPPVGGGVALGAWGLRQIHGYVRYQPVGMLVRSVPERPAGHEMRQDMAQSRRAGGPAIGRGSVPERLLAAATRLFAEHGYESTSVQEIVAVAGLTKGAMYHYLGSKDDLLYEVYARVLRMQSEHLVEIAGHDAPVTERVHTAAVDVIVTSIDNMDDTVIFFRSMHQLQESKQRTVRAERRKYHEIFRGMVEQGQEEGVLRTDVPADLVVDYYFGSVHHLSTWYRKGGPLTGADVGNHFADLLIAGLRPQDWSAGQEGGAPVAAPLRTVLLLRGSAVLLQLRAAQGAQMDLVGAVGQPQRTRTCHPTRQRQVLAEPCRPVRLDRLVQDPLDRARGGDLDRLDLGVCTLVADGVHQIGGLEHQKTHLLDGHACLGDPFPDHTLLGQGTAEGLTVQGPAAGHLQCPLGHADQPHAVVDTPRTQTGLSDGKALTFPTDEVFHGHAYVLEQHLGVAPVIA